MFAKLWQHIMFTKSSPKKTKIQYIPSPSYSPTFGIICDFSSSMMKLSIRSNFAFFKSNCCFLFSWFHLLFELMPFELMPFELMLFELMLSSLRARRWRPGSTGWPSEEGLISDCRGCVRAKGRIGSSWNRS